MIRYINELPIAGKTVFLRLDLNCPLDKKGEITDDTRIREALPTIRFALEQGARLVLASHLGRPDGKIMPEFSLEPVGKYLAEALNKEVLLVHDISGDGAHQMIRHSHKKDELFLLENLRFWAGEEENNADFAHELARLADIYINDAFGTCHRKHASIFGMPTHMAEVGAGFLIQKELSFLNRLIKEPEHPFVLVTGGSKVTDKLKAIDNLINHVDRLVVGGAMAYAFLSANGTKIGRSKCEAAGVAAAKGIMEKARARKVRLFLPEDHVVVYPDRDPDFTKPEIIDSADIPEGAAALDIGPKTRKRFTDAIRGAKTVFWNGPMGFFEKEGFALGTKEVAEAIAACSAIRVAGGGDTVSAIHHLLEKPEAGFDLLSTGGGASLQYLEGRGLPGIDILAKKGGSGRRSPNDRVLTPESDESEESES